VNEATAQKVVLGTFLVTSGVIVYDNLKKTGKAAPPAKTLVRLVVLGAVLALAAAAAPGIAGPFALLIGLAVVVSRVGVKAK
jgi:uncharacterized membrane protein